MIIGGGGMIWRDLFHLKTGGGRSLKTRSVKSSIFVVGAVIGGLLSLLVWSASSQEQQWYPHGSVDGTKNDEPRVDVYQMAAFLDNRVEISSTVKMLHAHVRRAVWTEEELQTMRWLKDDVDLRDNVDLGVLSTELPVCNKKKAYSKTFLLLTASHTGSTAILSSLLKHPDVHFEKQSMEPLNRPECIKNVTRALEITREIFDKGLKAGKMTGFKVNSAMIARAPDRWAKLVAEYNTKIIVGYRKNLFKRAVGQYAPTYLKAKMEGSELMKNTAMHNRYRRAASGHLTVEHDKLHCLMLRGHMVQKQVADAAAKLAGSNGCVLTVLYEDFLRHPHQTIVQAMKFLELRPYYRQPTRKTSNDDLCSVVENFGEICAHFAQCSSWSWMFEDSENNCSCERYEYKNLGGDGFNRYCNISLLDHEDSWCNNNGNKPAGLF